VRYAIALVVLFFLQGCSLNELFLYQEIDKITVVKYTPHVKHHRAYFNRTKLLPIDHGKKYLLLYNDKKKDLILILRKKDHYRLYHFFNLSRQPADLPSGRHITTGHLLRLFTKKGYRKSDLRNKGFIVTTGYRRYKGVKTLLIDIKDYRALKSLYEKAIRTYDATLVRSVHTPLPPAMIKPLLLRYYTLASNERQRDALRHIAKKLHLRLPGMQKSSEPIHPKENRKKSYEYYLHRAPISELKTYLNNPRNTRQLTDGEYILLKYRLDAMQQEALLESGSIEALIKAYKTNKDPRFKKRILDLMKEKQEEQH